MISALSYSRLPVLILAAVLLCAKSSADWKHGVNYDGCPCDQKEWCNPIEGTPDKEVVGFVLDTNTDHWLHYNWTHLTTLMVFTTPPSPPYQLVCYAHSKGVRVVIGGLNGFNISQLDNSTAREQWINGMLEIVQMSYADGINLDIEEPINNGSLEQELLTKLVLEVYLKFKSVNKNYQVTYDVAWSPNCIDGRCYQVDKFANITDFLVVMAYDEQSQIYGPCQAYANSPLDKTELGIKQYLTLGINPDKLVLGQPWYGYDYPCLKLTDDTVCAIEEVPYIGVNCSDAAGSQRDYSSIMKLARGAGATVKWNDTFKAPYFNQEIAGVMHQFWYDNPQSLSLKYSLAHDYKLKGVAIWNIDSLDYVNASPEIEDAAAMWSALDALFDD